MSNSNDGKGNEFSKRGLEVLTSIISEFINSAEPVSSRAISKKLNYSPATIRNEMADLEDTGYLYHTHTSGGRLPTNKAYRFYVDEVIDNYELPKKEKDLIKAKLNKNISEIDTALKNLTKTLSEATNLTAFAITPNKRDQKIEYINIVRTFGDQVLLTIINDNNEANSAIIRIKESFDDASLKLLSKSMSYFYRGKTITDALKKEIVETFLADVKSYENISKDVVPSFMKVLKSMLDTDVYFEGLSNIFEIPEYSDKDKAKDFFKQLSNKDEFIGLLSDGNDDIKITIGEENQNNLLKNNTLITATYHINGKYAGKLGVIGPTRIKYDKVTSIINYLKENIDDTFKL